MACTIKIGRPGEPFTRLQFAAASPADRSDPVEYLLYEPAQFAELQRSGACARTDAPPHALAAHLAARPADARPLLGSAASPSGRFVVLALASGVVLVWDRFADVRVLPALPARDAAARSDGGASRGSAAAKPAATLGWRMLGALTRLRSSPASPLAATNFTAAAATPSRALVGLVEAACADDGRSALLALDDGSARLWVDGLAHAAGCWRALVLPASAHFDFRADAPWQSSADGPARASAIAGALGSGADGGGLRARLALAATRADGALVLRIASAAAEPADTEPLDSPATPRSDRTSDLRASELTSDQTWLLPPPPGAAAGAAPLDERALLCAWASAGEALAVLIGVDAASTAGPRPRIARAGDDAAPELALWHGGAAPSPFRVAAPASAARTLALRWTAGAAHLLALLADGHVLVITRYGDALARVTPSGDATLAVGGPVAAHVAPPRAAAAGDAPSAARALAARRAARGGGAIELAILTGSHVRTLTVDVANLEVEAAAARAATAAAAVAAPAAPGGGAAPAKRAAVSVPRLAFARIADADATPVTAPTTTARPQAQPQPRAQPQPQPQQSQRALPHSAAAADAQPAVPSPREARARGAAALRANLGAPSASNSLAASRGASPRARERGTAEPPTGARRALALGQPVAADGARDDDDAAARAALAARRARRAGAATVRAAAAAEALADAAPPIARLWRGDAAVDRKAFHVGDAEGAAGGGGGGEGQRPPLRPLPRLLGAGSARAGGGAWGGADERAPPSRAFGAPRLLRLAPAEAAADAPVARAATTDAPAALATPDDAPAALATADAALPASLASPEVTETQPRASGLALVTETRDPLAAVTETRASLAAAVTERQAAPAPAPAPAALADATTSTLTPRAEPAPERVDAAAAAAAAAARASRAARPAPLCVEAATATSPPSRRAVHDAQTSPRPQPQPQPPSQPPSPPPPQRAAPEPHAARSAPPPSPAAALLASSAADPWAAPAASGALRWVEVRVLSAVEFARIAAPPRAAPRARARGDERSAAPPRGDENENDDDDDDDDAAAAAMEGRAGGSEAAAPTEAEALTDLLRAGTAAAARALPYRHLAQGEASLHARLAALEATAAQMEAEFRLADRAFGARDEGEARARARPRSRTTTPERAMSRRLRVVAVREPAAREMGWEADLAADDDDAAADDDDDDGVGAAAPHGGGWPAERAEPAARPDRLLVGTAERQRGVLATLSELQPPRLSERAAAARAGKATKGGSGGKAKAKRSKPKSRHRSPQPAALDSLGPPPLPHDGHGLSAREIASHNARTALRRQAHEDAAAAQRLRAASALAHELGAL